MNRFSPFRWIAVATAIVLSGCAMHPIETANSPPVPPKIEDDKFSSQITLIGETLYVNPYGGLFRAWKIRSWVTKTTKQIEHQLYVETSYIGEWKHFNAAADDHANALPVHIISSSVGNCMGGCSLYETVGIDLSQTLLEANRDSGFEIKLSAQDGSSVILAISKQQVIGQLDGMQRALDSIIPSSTQ